MSVSDEALHIYLNDHLAGAASGLALARRAAANAEDEERAAMWRTVAAEVAEDRLTLTHIRDLVGARPNPLKYAAAWTGEKLGRLKTNGRLWRRSELGQMLELELMVLGVTGKLALWTALSELRDPRLRSIDFEVLRRRAESQRDRLERSRVEIVPPTLGPG
ncbi:MAG: hypothetical protein J0H98_06190 [Solirubrobacterales bacterium]|nr:hypothetical protein [Solirubrobacterales bacterium]